MRSPETWNAAWETPASSPRQEMRHPRAQSASFPDWEQESFTVFRTEGQIFRERVGFLILCIIGAYCSMQVLVELKSILQPFLWALLLVMAWKPVIDSLEKRLEWALLMACCWLRPKYAKDLPIAQFFTSSTGNDEQADDEDAELQSILGDDTDFDLLPGAANLDDEYFEHGRAGASGMRSTASRGFRVRPRAREACQDVDSHDLEDKRAQWRLAIVRSLAVLLVFGFTLGVLSGFGFLILESARNMRNHWSVYQKGVQTLTTEATSLLSFMFKNFPQGMKTRYEDVTADVLKAAQDFMYGLLSNFVNNVSSLLFGGLLTLLYTLFWLCSPVPISASIDIMFRRYILFKTLACFGFGICVGMLLAFLSVDLASVFALTTFALNYVPEVGPYVAMVLPCPVILLDSRLDKPFLVLIIAVLGQLGLKFAFRNIIEVKLIESDKKLRMHPVMVLLSVALFGYLWGPTGMLLSVPLMALLKISLFSDLVPSSYRDPILVLLEGDRNAPQRHELGAPGTGNLGGGHGPCSAAPGG